MMQRCCSSNAAFAGQHGHTNEYSSLYHRQTTIMYTRCRKLSQTISTKSNTKQRQCMIVNMIFINSLYRRIILYGNNNLILLVWMYRKYTRVVNVFDVCNHMLGYEKRQSLSSQKCQLAWLLWGLKHPSSTFDHSSDFLSTAASSQTLQYKTFSTPKQTENMSFMCTHLCTVGFTLTYIRI